MVRGEEGVTLVYKHTTLHVLAYLYIICVVDTLNEFVDETYSTCRIDQNGIVNLKSSSLNVNLKSYNMLFCTERKLLL